MQVEYPERLKCSRNYSSQPALQQIYTYTSFSLSCGWRDFEAAAPVFKIVTNLAFCCRKLITCRPQYWEKWKSMYLSLWRFFLQHLHKLLWISTFNSKINFRISSSSAFESRELEMRYFEVAATSPTCFESSNTVVKQMNIPMRRNRNFRSSQICGWKRQTCIRSVPVRPGSFLSNG